ncbi:hypothetical protein [uncultured Pontibacter sp.]|uniref:hypothetical protein n=1 Tax=uncultured Pontibacter sp. TaxID=453356 RepID=UPI002611C244|nr:hypothetical protein [uncultured Pontibacter sp.]
MIRKLLLTLLFITGALATGYAQKYRTALGPRFESDKFGISIQQKLHEKGTIEGIATIGSNEYSGTALYEWHFPLLGKRFNYYVGAGAHVGNLKDSGVFTGADAILGLEYKVNGLPILLSADLKPAVHIHHADWVDLSSGISVRYVIVKEKKEKKSWWPFGNKEQDSKKKKRNQKEQENGSILDIFKKKDN